MPPILTNTWSATSRKRCFVDAQITAAALREARNCWSAGLLPGLRVACDLSAQGEFQIIEGLVYGVPASRFISDRPMGAGRGT